MEMLEDKIKAFLTVGYGFGDSHHNDCWSGCVTIDGDGDGSGFGDGSASGYGYDSGYGHGYGFGSGYGFSSASGYGYGDGYNVKMTEGYKIYVVSDFGHGNGNGYEVDEIQGYKIYIIDDTPTAITSVHDNIAQGFILQSDLQLKPCFIVKENNMFAHGETLRDAFTSLQKKLYDDSVNL